MIALDEGPNPMLLRRGIEEGAAAVADELRRAARPVQGADLLKVATIAAKEDAGSW
jgi:chaperonin GroEL